MLKALRITVVLVGWFAASAASAVLLAWLTGLVVSDRWRWSQWLAWMPTVVALAAAVSGWLAAWRPSRSASRRIRRLGVWSVVVVAILGFFLFVDNRPLRRTPAIPSDALRIVHWNVAPAHPEETDAIDLALDLQADLIVFTDAYLVPWQDHARQRLGDEANLLARFPFAFISTLPITQMRTLVAVDDIYAVLLEVDASRTSIGREILILAVDLPSDLSLPRMEIARRLRGLLDQSASPQQVDLVVGDFNITRGSASLSVIAPGMRHAWREAGRGWSASYPRSWALAHIDHVLVNTDTLRAVDYEIIAFPAARHRAQVVALEPHERTQREAP